MKLLNALEAFDRRQRRGRRVLREGMSDPAARAVPGLPAHHLRAVARTGLRRRARRPARRALAAGRRGGAGAGRDRAGAAGQRQDCAARCSVPAAADKAAIEAAALASPDFAKFAEGRAAEEGHRRAGPPGQRRRLTMRAAPPRRCCWLPRGAAAGRLRLRAARAAGAAVPNASRCTGFAPRSPLAEELRDTLERSAPQVVDAPAQAQVVLEALADGPAQRSVVASTAAGQVRELQLRAIFRFRAADACRTRADPRPRSLLIRDMSYIETAALAKEQEEAGPVPRDAVRHRAAGDAAAVSDAGL